MPFDDSATVDESLKEEAADLICWLIGRIPPSAYGTGKVQRKRWDWAEKGLRKATRYNADFDRMIEKLVDVLPINGALGKSVGEKVTTLRTKLKSADQTHKFRKICRENATMIIVRAQQKYDRHDASGLDPDADPEDFPTLHEED